MPVQRQAEKVFPAVCSMSQIPCGIFGFPDGPLGFIAGTSGLAQLPFSASHANVKNHPLDSLVLPSLYGVLQKFHH
jgi:hypothetical protein